MTDSEILNLVTKRFNTARTNQISWFEKFSRWYGLYRGYQYRKNYFGRANLFIPASFWTVESYVPRLNRSLRDIKATSQEEKDQKNERVVSELLAFQRDQMGWDSFIKNWIRGSGIYGSYDAKVSWDKELDMPVPSLVDIMDVFWDPQADKVKKARWVIHRTQKHYDELEAAGIYKNLDKVMPRGTPPADEGFKLQRRAILSVAQRPYDSSAKMVDVYEFWGFIGAEGDVRESNRLIVVANKNTVIRDEPNPFLEILPGNALPFVKLYDTDTPHEMYGIGEIEPIEKLQEELNDTRNQRMDNVNLMINQQYEVIRSADISEEDFVSLPGKVYFSNIPNGIRPLPVQDSTRVSIDEEKMIKEDIQQTTIGTPNVDIRQAQQSDTATGIMAAQESGDTRTEYKVLNLKDAVRDLWRIILALNQKFITKEYVIRLEGPTGTTWKTIKPKDIKGRFDIDIEVESQQNRLVKKQEAMQLYQLATKTPGANIGKFFIDLLQLFDRPNPEAYYQEPKPTPPPPQLSVSLKGDLTGIEADEILRMHGMSQQATDPIYRPEYRRMMFPNSKEPAHLDEQQLMAEAAPQGAPAGAPAQGQPNGSSQPSPGIQ